jgi:dihydrolipoamide dehydrogenase
MTRKDASKPTPAESAKPSQPGAPESPAKALLPRLDALMAGFRAEVARAMEETAALAGAAALANQARAESAAPIAAAMGIPEGDWDVQVAVIGGGPGGEDCARDLADHGIRVALINNASLPGGECLWRGCIPSKAWRHAADILRDRRHDADKGILGTAQPVLDWNALEAHRRGIQEDRGEMALKADRGMKIRAIQGYAAFVDAHTLNIQPEDDEVQTLTFGAAVIATGAPPFVPPIPGAREGLAGGGVLTSDSIWNLPHPPRKLGIVGGGVIGVEMAQIWRDFGADILMLEARERILAEMEEEVAGTLADLLEHEINLLTGVTIAEITGHPGNMMIKYATPDGARHQYLCDYVLMATGKRPATGGLNLAAAGIELEGHAIRVDTAGRTSVPHIFAVGDVVGGYMLAHTAAAQGRVAAANLLGRPRAYDPDLDCAVTFSRPEAGFVGLSLAQAKARGIDAVEVKMPMALDAKAMIALETRGLIKLVADKASGRVIGAHFLADHTDTLIGAAVLMISGRMTLEQVAEAIFPHPTQTEIFGELARRLLARLRRTRR